LRDGLVGGEGWVDNRMRYISGHERSALIWSYWSGEPAVRPVWERVRDDPTKHAAFFSYVYDRLQSVESVAAFEPVST
jgi:hypothetical protein